MSPAEGGTLYEPQVLPAGYLIRAETRYLTNKQSAENSNLCKRHQEHSLRTCAVRGGKGVPLSVSYSSESLEDEVFSFVYSLLKKRSRIALDRKIRKRKKGLKFRDKKGRDTRRYADHKTRLKVLLRDKFRCRYCGKKVTMDTANIDHVRPWKRRGPTTPKNLVTACRSCNKQKGNQLGWKPNPVPT